MSLINVNVPNLLNGVSQQADPLRFVTQGKEQINGMSSIVNGLSKRNGTEFVAKLSSLSIQNRKPLVHFINRDTEEKYVVLFYSSFTGNSSITDDVKGQIRVFDLKTGEEKLVFGKYEDLAIPDYGEEVSEGSTIDLLTVIPDYDTEDNPAVGMSFYVGSKPDELKIFTLADSTFILNPRKTIRTTPASRPAALTNKTVTRVGTTATVNLGTNVSNSVVEIGEVIQVLGTAAAIAGAVKVTGKPTGTSFTFDALDVGPTTYTGVSFEKGERFFPIEMPHTLIRRSDGTFFLRRNYWNARAAGTPTTNPNPSFVGKKINDIFFYRSRLGFLCDENVILSENSEFFNFYRTDMSTLLDSDPIDVSTSHSKVTILHNALPFSERLVLFSDEAQFYMTATDILTPKTASIQQTTEFSVDKSGKPILVGKNIFFPFSRGEYSGIMEYFLTQDTLEFNGIDVTSPIPSYIKGRITKIASSSNEQVVALLTKDTKNTIYIYKYFTTEDQKLQSSWSKWELPEDKKILGMEFIDNALYLVTDYFFADTDINRKSGFYLEKINIKDFFIDDTSDFFIKLDSKVNEQQVLSSSYSNEQDTTTFSLPYKTNKEISVVSRYEDSTVLETFDSTPENDGLRLSENFDNFNEYVFSSRGTSTAIFPMFQHYVNYGATVQDTIENSTLSLTNRPRRNWYSVGPVATEGNSPTDGEGFIDTGIICRIVYPNADRTFPANNIHYQTYEVIHWAIEKYVNGNLLAYYVSPPYIDFDIDLNSELPSTLPQYPWEVKKWTNVLPWDFVTTYIFNGQALAYITDWQDFLVPYSVDKKDFPKRGNPVNSVLLPPTKSGKLFTVVSQQEATEVWDDTEGSELNQVVTSVTIKGNHLTTPLWFGIPYDFRYEFSNPILRGASGGGQRTAITDGRFQVKNGNLTFNDTVVFNIEVTAPFRNKNVYKFSNYTLGRGDAVLDTLPVKSGSFRFPVLSRNDKELKVEIVNNTPFPSSFISMDWEAFYSARARRI